MSLEKRGPRAGRLPSSLPAVLGSLCLAGLLLAPPPSAAQAIDEDLWVIARGGQLYDDWAATLDTEVPETTHPAYPAAGRKKGRLTWRCKECHGWDYKGEDGAYGKGPHVTGIKGVRRMVGVDPEEIAKIITDETHAYTPEMIPPAAVTKLALFLSRGQIEMAQYIDRDTREALGNMDRGAAFYQTICRICHGFDGARMSFESETTAKAAVEDPKYLGALANKNPWEVLHKIRNGQPGVGMVALRVLSVQDQVDVLAYLQTLPVKPR